MLSTTLQHTGQPPDPYRRLSDPKLSIGLRLRQIDLKGQKVYIAKDFYSSMN